MNAIALDAEHGLRRYQEYERDLAQSWQDYEDWAQELSAEALLDHMQSWLERTTTAHGEVRSRYSMAPFPGELATIQFNAESAFKRWHYANRYPGVKP